MQYQSIEFLIFLFLVCLVYYGGPKAMRRCWLLLASWAFYLTLSAELAFYLAGITVVSWMFGLWIGKVKSRPKGTRRFILAVAIIATLASLIVVKYGNFVLENIKCVIEGLSLDMSPSHGLELIQPVGLSFFTFMAIGYLIDVYQGKRKSEKSLIAYALFMAFFPMIMSGPIERSTGLLQQIDECHNIKMDTYKIRHGLVTIFYGFFLKVMVADRLNILVNTVFSAPETYGGCILVLAVVAFGIQLYCDFAGVSAIAIGSAEVMGFSIMKNFDNPYFAVSVSEFWRRWHISLSSWFRDYLYIPLGGSKKGKWRKYLNLMIVFLVSGLWHGAGWTFIIWGGLHGVYQVAGDLLKPVRKKIVDVCSIDAEGVGNRVLRMIFNFILVDFAWMFFRAADMNQAIVIMKRAVAAWNPWELFNGVILELGLGWPDLTVLLICLMIVLVMSVLEYNKIEWKDALLQQGFPVRLLVYVGCITALIVFGIYGPAFSASSFIYVDF